MRLAPHFTHTVAAGAVVAAALLVFLGADDGAGPAAPIRALARAQSIVERQGRVESTERRWHGVGVVAARVDDAVPAPASSR